VQHYEDPHAYDDTHRELLEAIAAQAAIALENARLYQLTDIRLQERVEELTALVSITRELNSTLQMERIFDLVLDGAMQATGAEYSSIYLLDPEREILQRRAVRGYEATTAPEGQAVGQGIIGRTVVTGQPNVVEDVTQDPDYLRVIPDVRSELCVPISYAGSVVGAINLESRLTAAFHPDDVSFVSALAAQAAIAIGNAQRLEEQMQRSELLRRRAEQLSNLARHGRWGEMPGLVNDEILAACALVCPPEELGLRLKDRYAGLADRLGLYLPFLPGQRDEFWRALLRQVAG
jgi:GAF domain-containing protein